MADGVRTNFMVFPNIRICLAPFGDRYHRFGVVDSPESHHHIPVETHGRASLQSRVRMDMSCVHSNVPVRVQTIIIVHISTIIPIHPCKCSRMFW